MVMLCRVRDRDLVHSPERGHPVFLHHLWKSLPLPAPMYVFYTFVKDCVAAAGLFLGPLGPLLYSIALQLWS